MPNKIILSHDISKKNRLLAYGGTGYGHLLRTVQNQAIEVAEISPAEWHQMTHTRIHSNGLRHKLHKTFLCVTYEFNLKDFATNN